MNSLEVVLPTLFRPERIEPLYRNLVETTPALLRLWIVLWSEDARSIKEMERLQALPDTKKLALLLSSERSVTHRTNHGFNHTIAPLVFVAQDDHEFTPGWFEEARAEMKVKNVPVVEPWDPLGKQGCRGWLIQHQYIELVSGVVDRPNLIFNDAYDHWFSDTEFIETAENRGAYAVCESSIVNHHNPSFSSKFKRDMVNDMPFETLDRDKAIYNSRTHLFRGKGAI